MKRIIIIGIILIAVIKVNAQTYNPVDAAEYAREYCNKRNLQYNDYLGADCANFVSQCLIAGGLDLSVGIDPNMPSPQNGVDDKGCISGVLNLVKHLKNYQQTEYFEFNGYPSTLPNNFDVGDPMFKIASTTSYPRHSHICSSRDGYPLYCTHTGDYCNRDMSSWFDSSDKLVFFHIKSSFPNHCFDCEKNGDETSIDCGGSCPPCVHAPNERTYNYNTTPSNPLPEVTYAINRITAGNADVVIYPGQQVAFHTAGSVELYPGFTVMPGASFEVHMKAKREDATADCNAFCDPEVPYNVFNRTDEQTLQWEIANATRVFVRIYQMNLNQRWKSIYNATVYLYEDGMTTLWDLNDGNPDYSNRMFHQEYEFGTVHMFLAEVIIYSCQGTPHLYQREFYVANAN